MSNPRQLRRWLRGYLKQDRVILIIALVCAIGVALTSLAVAYLLKPYLDAASKGTVNAHALKQISFISLEVVGLYALRGLFTYFETILFAEAGLRLAMRLRNDIYEHLQGLSLGYFNKQRTGALMSTINNDVPLLQSVLTSMKDIATAPFLVLGGLIVIFKISWHLSLGAIVCVPLMALTIGWFTRKIRQITTTTQDKLSDVNALMEESLSGVRIIQSFTAEKQTVRRFRGENLSAMELTMSGVRQFAKIKPLTDIIGAVGVALALWVAGAVVVEGRLTLGDLGKFIFTLNQIAVGIGGLGAAKVSWEQIHAAGGRIRENVLDIDSDIKDAPDAVDLGPVEGRVEFQDVAFSYHANTPVLKSVSFTMHPGEVVAVVAPSGAGKSTIADLLARFYDPTAGQVLVDGHDIRQVKLESLRRQIGIVPQETVLFVGTIRDNIVFGNPDATDAMVEAAAKAANAHHFISDPSILPDGYATVVGERGKQLSGGQRQRIAIARALLKDPRILILDEATSSLDAESEILVQEALDELTQRRTTLVIAHRLSTIINAHKILVLQDGRIAEVGTHAELIRKPNGLYARYYESHSRWEDDPSPTPTAASAS